MASSSTRRTLLWMIMALFPCLGVGYERSMKDLQRIYTEAVKDTLFYVFPRVCVPSVRTEIYAMQKDGGEKVRIAMG
eukprot:568577-Amorphochlora_amoeboformis.AAC.1